MCCEPRTARAPAAVSHCALSQPALQEKTPPLPCITVPLNLLETGGTRWIVFDFQSRPVGHNHSYNPLIYQLRFKDIVSNHEHRQGKLIKYPFSFPKNAGARCAADLLKPLSPSPPSSSSKKYLDRKNFRTDSRHREIVAADVRRV